MRAFIAIEIPGALHRGVAAAQARLKSSGVDASWPRPEGVHLTLKFLGDVGEERGPEIVRALALALIDTEGFRLCLEGVGAFPSPARARVVWLGISGDVGKLVALQAAVEHAMAALGLAPDSRPFTPHLTIGRIRRISDREAWLAGLAQAGNFKLPGFDATAVSLISSTLKPTGALYRELGKVSFKPKPE